MSKYGYNHPELVSLREKKAKHDKLVKELIKERRNREPLYSTPKDCARESSKSDSLGSEQDEGTYDDTEYDPERGKYR